MSQMSVKQTVYKQHLFFVAFHHHSQNGIPPKEDASEFLHQASGSYNHSIRIPPEHLAERTKI
jgi:hypothetical protein